MLTKLFRDRRGVTTIEYAILAVGIISAVVLATGVLSTDLTDAFTTIGDQLKAAM